MAGSGTITIVSNLFYSLLRLGNTVEILDREKLDQYVTTDRPDNTPLITVSNHISTLDDPGLVSAMYPWQVRTSHKRMRWGICTEEICFSNPFLGAFFAAGKALPVQRGGSIYQKGIATLADKLTKGDWIHVFPEGRVWQEGGIPLRDKEGKWCSGSGRCGLPYAKLGPMKWGIGKLVANAEKLPIILPYFHMGMNDVIPQDHNNQVIGSYPNFFANTLITVKFGDPIPVQDLIDNYHEAARIRAEERNQERAERIRKEEVKRQRSWFNRVLSSIGNTLNPWGSRNGKETKVYRHETVSLAAATRPPVHSTAATTINLHPSVTPLIDQLPSSSSTKESAYIAGLSVSAKSQPIHTDEMFSDHSGESARVAGIAQSVSTHSDEVTKSKTLASSSSSSVNTTVMETKLREAKDTADRVLEKMETEARELRLSAQVRSQAAAERAKELITRLRTFADEGEEKAKLFSTRIEKEAREMLPKEISDILDRISTSVSYPMPEKVQVPMNSTSISSSSSTNNPSVQILNGTDKNTNGITINSITPSVAIQGSSPLAINPSSSSTTTTAVASTTVATVSAKTTNVQTTYGPTKRVSSLSASDTLFPLSDEPVIEVIPTRRLKTGTIVPMYLEAPLRIKPPDHEYLTYEEAVEEEVVRLQLYSDIATRIHDSLLGLEREVMRYRKEKGYIERRGQS